jgi:hypothetical protein
MKPAFPWAALRLAAALAMVPIGASAEAAASPGNRHEVVIDIDRDGRPDRAVLLRHPRGAAADLLIYLGAGSSEALDLSRLTSARTISRTVMSCNSKPTARAPRLRAVVVCGRHVSSRIQSWTLLSGNPAPLVGL